MAISQKNIIYDPTPDWSEIENKPTAFPPEPHTHPLSDIQQSGATTGQVPQWDGTAWVPATVSGGGSPGGSGTEVQYRVDASTFGAMAGTAWDNTNRTLTITGATVTTSQPLLNLSQTWNDAAVDFIGLQFNAINTASHANSRLLSLSVNGDFQFGVGVDGAIVTSKSFSAYDLVRTGRVGIRHDGSDRLQFGVVFGGSVSGRFSIHVLEGWSVAQAGYGFAADVSLSSVTPDLWLRRDAANILAQRNGTAAQTFRAYNTFTNASNGEWLSIGWASNVCTITPQAAGTGTLRPLIVRHPPVTVASLPSASSVGAGARCMVSDASAPVFGDVVAGGGSIIVPVYSDGTDWRVG
jgi:hypothetical protein